MKRIYIFIICLVFTRYSYTQNMVITVPVASLRTAPKDYTIGQEHDATESRDMFGPSYEIFMEKLAPALRDPQQDTQLLYNEQVICLEDLKNGFLKVELPEQYGYNGSKKCFEHIVGYIKKNQAVPIKDKSPINLVVSATWSTITDQDNKRLTVPMGTKLHGKLKNQTQYKINLHDGSHGTIASEDVYLMSKNPEPENILRALVVARAKQLVGGSYNWGGLCPSAKEHITPMDFATSCDCSGAIKLSHRASGLEIARNAHAQWLRSAKVESGADLKPGDLIFFARPTRKDRVHHVIMYLGDNQVFESCASLGIVIQKSEERFGKPVAELSYGDTIKTLSTQGANPAEYVIYFGSYLSDNGRVQYMRDYALGNYDVTRWVKDEQKS